MKHIILDISEEAWKSFKEIAENYDTKANRILAQFIFDLTASPESGGSDERDKADEWLSRSRYNF